MCTRTSIGRLIVGGAMLLLVTERRTIRHYVRSSYKNWSWRANQNDERILTSSLPREQIEKLATEEELEQILQSITPQTDPESVDNEVEEESNGKSDDNLDNQANNDEDKLSEKSDDKNQNELLKLVSGSIDHKVPDETISPLIEATSIRGPYFDKVASKNVTALVGHTAYLNCRVRNLGNRTVSWVRHRGIHLLTVGRYTYTSDQRFQAIHSPQNEDWTLQIRYPQIRDSGYYECQVGTTPPIGHAMVLTVVEPITTIIGGPDMFINKGSTMNLTCIIKHSPEPPPLIYWTHDSKEINYDSARGGVSVITEKGEVTTSYLLVQRATSTDSGKYTCHPSNANPHTVVVHVLNGEHPAAMQKGSKLSLKSSLSFLSVGLVLFIST